MSVMPDGVEDRIRHVRFHQIVRSSEKQIHGMMDVSWTIRTFLDATQSQAYVPLMMEAAASEQQIVPLFFLSIIACIEEFLKTSLVGTCLETQLGAHTNAATPYLRASIMCSLMGRILTCTR